MDYGTIPAFRLTGGPRLRGETYGEAASGLIAQAVDLYRAWFGLIYRVDWEEALRAAAGVWPVLRGVTPDLAEEIEGIAAGANRPLMEIVALNARTEIAMAGVTGRLPGAGAREPEGCTSFAVLPEHTGGYGLIAGQNWDWSADCMGIRVALHVQLEDGRQLLTFCEAGQVGKIGINSEGVIVCLNMLSTEADSTRGLPVHVICRKALEQRYLSDAMRVVAMGPRAASGNLLVAVGTPDGDGEALDVEYSPRLWRALEAEDGLIVHTNHFLADCGAADQVLTRPGSKSSFLRLARARRLFRRALAGGGIAPSAAAQILADHLDRPYGICRHVPDRPDENGQTNLAVIFVPSRGEFWLSDGPPCGEGREGPAFRQYPLPWRSEGAC